MKAKKVLLTVLAVSIMAGGVFVSPCAAGNVAYAEEVQSQGEAQEAEPELTPEQQAAKEKEEAMLALRNDPNHVHKFKWVAHMNESESAEGTMNYMCTECGKTWYYRSIPAYTAFSGETAYKIETAPEGATVKIKTSLFISFNADVMKALAARPDVSLYVSFLDQEYKGNRVSFTIPAGEDTMALVDQNGYVGFLFLGGKYGLKMEVPMEPVEDTTESAEAAEASDSTENTGNTEKDLTTAAN